MRRPVYVREERFPPGPAPQISARSRRQLRRRRKCKTLRFAPPGHAAICLRFLKTPAANRVRQIFFSRQNNLFAEKPANSPHASPDWIFQTTLQYFLTGRNALRSIFEPRERPQTQNCSLKKERGDGFASCGNLSTSEGLSNAAAKRQTSPLGEVF